MDATTLVRVFNLLYAIALAVYVISRIFRKSYRVYRWANTAYALGFIYSITAYTISFITGVQMPALFSALGATIQFTAMLIAIISEVEWHK